MTHDVLDRNLDITLAPRPTRIENDLPYNTLETGVVTKTIDAKLVEIIHADDQTKVDELVDELVEPATELAARILSRETCEDLHIDTAIKDNQGIDYPPTRDNILRLAYCAEVTGNDTLELAFEESIKELPEDTQKIFEEALESKKAGDFATFNEALIYLELTSSSGEDSVEFTRPHAKGFVDFNANIDPLANYNDLSINDERLEMLVRPVPTSAEGYYSTHLQPRVEFYAPKATEARLKLGSVSVQREVRLKAKVKIDSMNNAIYSTEDKLFSQL